MNLLNLRWIFLIGLIAGSVLAEEIAAKRTINKFNAADLFSLIADQAPLFVGKGWNDGLTQPERWRKKMKEDGLKDFSSDTWNIVDQTGELRVSAYFLKDKISFFVYFFPADHNPIPAALLSTLLSKAESSSTDEASTIELNFPSEIKSNDEYLVSKTGYMKIKLQSGILASQSKLIECSAQRKD